MSEPLFDYQVNQENYVRSNEFVYSILKNGAEKYLGGIVGKTVLDLGAGFSLPQGGLPSALAVRDGARQCFGIDISNPDFFATDPQKVAFWKAAKDLLAVDVQGLNENRVYFGAYDTLHFDSFVSRIVALQMSASDMWFKDNMFDLVISNAVFEHVKDAKAVLQEVFRVLKPGGGIYAHWNPHSSFLMGGHDIGVPFLHPWAHLRLSKEEHVKILAKMLNDPELLRTANPPEHTITPERAKTYANSPDLLFKHMDDDLNKLRIRDLLTYAREVGFEIVHSGHHFRDEHAKYLTPEIRAELSDYTDDDLLTVFHSFAFRKPL